jgi:hypothetical protein
MVNRESIIMKKAFFYLLVLQTAFLYCCNKSAVIHNEDIIGKWKLRDHYYSIGGPIIQETIDPQNPLIVEFHADGRLTSNDSSFSADHYQLLNDSVMTMITKNSSLDVRYTLTDSLLGIYPPCFEGCGYKYVPVH